MEADMVAMPEVPEVRHRWHAVNGTRLHVAEAGPETAPAVVLLHGFHSTGTCGAH